MSWDALHAKLLEREWHVLHFIGHGTYDTVTDEGVLAFVGRNGRADYVTASALADLLDEAEPTPRLVVLNSCQSGAGGTTDLFSGTAAALAHSGIRAVAAMQFSISDAAALAFARGFYTALAHNRGIDEAVRSGRIGILGLGRGTLEWVTPVLYLRGDAELFDLAAPSAALEAKQPPPQRPARTDLHPVAGPEHTQPEGASAAKPTRSFTWRRWAVVGVAAALVIGAGVAVAAAMRLGPFAGDQAGSESGRLGQHGRARRSAGHRLGRRRALLHSR